MRTLIADLILKSPWWFYSRLPISWVTFAWKNGNNVKLPKNR